MHTSPSRLRVDGEGREGVEKHESNKTFLLCTPVKSQLGSEMIWRDINLDFIPSSVRTDHLNKGIQNKTALRKPRRAADHLARRVNISPVYVVIRLFLRFCLVHDLLVHYYVSENILKPFLQYMIIYYTTITIHSYTSNSEIFYINLPTASNSSDLNVPPTLLSQPHTPRVACRINLFL